jgi:hypothetical protein
MKIFKLSGGAKWGSTFAQRMEEQTNDFVITRASKSLHCYFSPNQHMMHQRKRILGSSKY